MLAVPAMAKTLLVGPARVLKTPSQAAAIAQPGDVVRIENGLYADCAVWTPNNLTIQGVGRNVILTDRTCLNQGIFVVFGSNVTIQGLTFRNASVPGRNGAGIKMNGDNLTVLNSRFENNENGILAGGTARSTLRIADSSFIGNGACIEACAHAVYAGAPIGLLLVERCVFLDTRTAHHIKSRALNTIVRDTRIEDGESGTSSYLIEAAQGGGLLVQNNDLQKGPNSDNPGTAIAIGASPTRNPTQALVIRDNRFRSDVRQPTVFVRNYTDTPVQLIDNNVVGTVQMLEGPGTVTP
ncbi:MAG: hypothetical protein U1E70_11560 [Acetobacteraceae bacterium]|nr:hypothetical protein [Pseudomonadota bacterium]